MTSRSVVLEPLPATPELRNRPATVWRRCSSMKVSASSSTLKEYRFRGTQWLLGQKAQSILQKSVNITRIRLIRFPLGMDAR